MESTSKAWHVSSVWRGCKDLCREQSCSASTCNLPPPFSYEIQVRSGFDLKLSCGIWRFKRDFWKWILEEARLTICGGHDGTETSNGDVLIFPDMIRYRRLMHFDVNTFVEEVFIKDSEWLL
ncbi:hypothetical protein GIB67_037321, partial [Kingdonia uniflora]